MALILHYFTEFVHDVIVKQLDSLLPDFCITSGYIHNYRSAKNISKKVVICSALGCKDEAFSVSYRCEDTII